MGIENSQFSAREKEVIDLLLQGKSNKQIAFELHIAQSTVEYHLKNIYHKLEVASRTEAVIQLGKSISNHMPTGPGDSAVEIDSKSAGKSMIIVRLLTMVLIVGLIFSDRSVRTRGAIGSAQWEEASDLVVPMTAVFIYGENPTEHLLHLVNPADKNSERKKAPLLNYDDAFSFYMTKDHWKRLESWAVFAITIIGDPKMPPPKTCNPRDPDLILTYCEDYRRYRDMMEKVMEIRKDHKALEEGDFVPLKWTSNMISFARIYKGQTIIVVLNLSETQQNFTVPLQLKESTCPNVNNLWPEIAQNLPLVNNGALSGTWEAWEAKILKCE